MNAAAQYDVLRGQLTKNAKLANLNSWKVGGTADTLYKPADVADLQIFLNSLRPDEPITWLGLGTNVLVRDGGIRGTVIVLHRTLDRIRQLDNTKLYAEAGAACVMLARMSADLGLTGGEFLAGIPGSIGGALAMNAGAFEGNTWQLVDHVETIHRSGTLKKRYVEDFNIGYRSVQLPTEEWFIAGIFMFQNGDKTISLQKIRNLLNKRAATQPLNAPNCGSVFRNPPNLFAGELIERCGLKGARIGEAVVSAKHANFIINEGNATAHDIEKLITLVQQKVLDKCGILLQCEVRLMGEY